MFKNEPRTTKTNGYANTTGSETVEGAASKAAADYGNTQEVQALIEASTPKKGEGYAYQDPLFTRVMCYEFPALIDRVIDKEGWSEVAAQELFLDLKGFLYLCGTKQQDAAHLSPPEVVDTIWHHYILHTKEYAKFCEDHFQAFIHHTPFTRSQKQKMVQGGSPRESVERTQDIAGRAFGKLSANWFALGYDRELGSLVVGYGNCSGSTNCQSDVPCC